MTITRDVVLCFFAMYLAGSFVSLEYDFRLWTESGRVIYLILTAVFVAFVQVRHIK